ncbi:MAG: hypothetical protein MUC70_06290 [Bacteroidales bacterium]|nr:hypothetical protein [Bacteroidales bacterium]
MRVIIFAPGYSYGMLEIPDLGEPEINGKKQSGANQQDHEPGMATEIAVERY